MTVALKRGSWLTAVMALIDNAAARQWAVVLTMELQAIKPASPSTMFCTQFQCLHCVLGTPNSAYLTANIRHLQLDCYSPTLMRNHHI